MSTDPSTEALRQLLHSQGVDDAGVAQMIDLVSKQSAQLAALADEPMPPSPAAYVDRAAVSHDLIEQLLGDVRVDVCRADDQDVSLGFSVAASAVDPEAAPEDDPDDDGVELFAATVTPEQGQVLALAIARASTPEPDWDLDIVRITSATRAPELEDRERAREVLAAFGLAHVLAG